MPGYVYAKDEVVAYLDDGTRVVTHVDEAWSADDPAVKERPDLFNDSPIDPRGTRPVEQATQAPDEQRPTKRGPGRPRKSDA